MPWKMILGGVAAATLGAIAAYYIYWIVHLVSIYEDNPATTPADRFTQAKDMVGAVASAATFVATTVIGGIVGYLTQKRETDTARTGADTARTAAYTANRDAGALADALAPFVGRTEGMSPEVAALVTRYRRT